MHVHYTDFCPTIFILCPTMPGYTTQCSKSFNSNFVDGIVNSVPRDPPTGNVDPKVMEKDIKKYSEQFPERSSVILGLKNKLVQVYGNSIGHTWKGRISALLPHLNPPVCRVVWYCVV